MNKDTRRNFEVGVTIFVAIVCLVSTLVLLSHSNKEGIVFAQSDSNASKFKAIRSIFAVMGKFRFSIHFRHICCWRYQ